MNVESILKDEFSNLKHIEKGLLLELMAETDPDNIQIIEDSLVCIRYSLEKCIQDMKFFGIVVGARKK